MKAPRNLTVSIFNKIFIITTILTLLSFSNVKAQQLAFPNAKGAGAYATGGRGGQIIHVTTLDWSAPGGLKEALQTPGARTIVFDVSGEIDATSQSAYSLIINGSTYDNLTIVGQSAPEGGITIRTKSFQFQNVNNIIIRYIRFRHDNTADQDGFGILGGTNIILDHCTFSHGADESASFATSSGSMGDVTVQNCFFQDSKTGTILGVDDVNGDFTFINNAYSGISHRFPNPKGNGHYDIINNVVYNWKYRLVRITGEGTYNVMNNYYKPAANGLKQPGWFSGPISSSFLQKLQTQETDNPLIYTSGNIIVGQRESPQTDDSDMWTVFAGSHLQENTQVPAQYFSNDQFSLSGESFTIKSANEAYLDILQDVGANKTLNSNGTIFTYRDTKDEGDILMIQNDTYNGSFFDDRNSIPYPIIPENVRLSSFYVSNPHIPEVWFQANVPEGQDHNDIAPSGYTWLEEYLNQVDGPTIFVEGVVVSPSTASITIPETVTLSTTITPSNAFNQSGVWSSGDTSIATVNESGVVTPIAPGVVIITFTSNDGGFTATSEITVLPEALQVSAGDDQQICEGNTTTLSASGGTSYLWNTGETTASIEVNPNETTTYTVTVSDDFGQSEEATVTVIVNPIPVANAGEDQAICEGESVTLIASGGDSYIWSNGATTATITVSPTIETIYTVEAISNNCSSTDSVIVRVNPAPNVSVNGDFYIYNGDFATLTATGAETYQWSTSDNSDSITVNPTETTTYSVTGFANGCEKTIEVTVNVLEPISANAGEDVAICSGESVTLIATGGISYSWDSGETEASITVSPTQTTTYTVTVMDNLGGTATDSVTITVNELPSVSVSDNMTLMQGENTTLTASGAQTYLWNTGQTTASITVNPQATTTYTVTGYLNSCEDSAQVTVTVIPELVANAGNDVSICQGESVTLNASGGITYTWSNGVTGASQTVNPTETTTYTVTVTDNFGNSDSDSVTVTVNEIPNVTVSENITIIEGESTNLIAQGAETYLWSTGQTSNMITVSPTQTTTYVVEGTSNTCSASVEVTVTVEPLFVASAGADERVCEDSSYEVVLTANQGDSYLWSTGQTTQSIVVSPLSTTTYSVTVFQNQQQDTDDVTVFVDPTPNVTIVNGDSVDILNGDFITLSATGANTYEWNNGATQPNIAVSPSSTTTYEVKGYVGECYEQKQVVVNVFQPVVADAGENMIICPEETVTLTATGGDEYLWSTGDITQSIEVSPMETTEYSVTVFNAIDFDVASVVVEVDINCQNDSIDEIATANFSFDILPNPAHNFVNIKLSGTSITSEVYIYDITGKLVKRKTISNENLNLSSTANISVEAFQSGVYFVKVKDRDRDLTKKLIIE